ncbi:MAG: SDR family oxidoreductase [Cyanosarcina radialis HA8281-LM2]|jgi:short-subunit dehydrogenase|nr:SDR family oxidoreductase [Cyanosarcina radialis HA8281-LM2]
MPSDRKSVLITGCSSGIGRGLVDEFMQRGWHVFATIRNLEQRQDLVAELLGKYPDRLTILDLEVTDKIQRDAVVKVVKETGRLDCLVNNAGFGLLGVLENLSEEQIRYQMEVNFYAPAFLTRDLLPLLRQTKGKVVFVSSVCGYVGFPLMSAYCASKYGLEGLAESLYYEIEPHGVDVSLIEVGLTKSNFGDNVIWGTGEIAAYRLQTDNYHQEKAKLSLKAKNNISLIGKRVAEIAEGRIKKLRIRVGEEAQLTHLFQRLLPATIWVNLLKRFHRQKLLKK